MESGGRGEEADPNHLVAQHQPLFHTVSSFFFAVPKHIIIFRKSSNATVQSRGRSVFVTNQDPTLKFLVDLKASRKKKKEGSERINQLKMIPCVPVASLSP